MTVQVWIHYSGKEGYTSAHIMYIHRRTYKHYTARFPAGHANLMPSLPPCLRLRVTSFFRTSAPNSNVGGQTCLQSFTSFCRPCASRMLFFACSKQPRRACHEPPLDPLHERLEVHLQANCWSSTGCSARRPNMISKGVSVDESWRELL